jgi:carboxyl-terminal processing protease
MKRPDTASPVASAASKGIRLPRLHPSTPAPPMTTRRRVLLPLAIAALVATAGCAHRPVAAPADDPRLAVEAAQPVSRALALETFDVVWKTIEERHFDATHNGVDWVAVREEFRPKVETVTNQAELRVQLGAMISRLGQSHFGIIPRDLSDDEELAGEGEAASTTGSGGDLGVFFRLVNGAIMTVAPRPEGPAARAGLGAGWRITAVQGSPLRVPPPPAADAERNAMRRYATETMAAHRIHAAPGEQIELTGVDPAGVERTVTITAEAVGGEVVRFGNLPPFETVVHARPIASDEFSAAGVGEQPLPASVGLIAFNVWMLPAAAGLDAAIDRFRGADGIILDVRGNPGGLGAMAMGIGGHFFTQPKSLGRMTNREGFIDFLVNPRRATADGRLVKPYAGPLAILVDPLSASTSEIFAAGLQELGRAVVIGQTTAGAALPSMATELPNGDVLQFAVADFVTPEGNRIEGHGVVPDLPVELTPDLLAREPDPVLAAALRWIADAHRQAARTPPTS